MVGISSEVEAAEDLGLIRSLQWKAITVDADVWGAQAENADRAAIKSWTILTSLNASTLERKVFEAYNVNSVSAEKALLLASQQSIPILHIDETNIAGILPGLPYPASIKGEIQSWVNGGGVADIPESPLSYIEWAGVGYILSDPATGEAKYQLSGSLSGGITVVPIEDVLHAISDFLASISNQTINPNPDDATHLVTVGFAFGMPINEVNTEIPFPLVVAALDAQGRRVSSRPITFSINGNAVLIDDQGTEYPGSYSTQTNNSGVVNVRIKLGTKTSSAQVQPYYLRLNETDPYDTQLGLYRIDAVSGTIALAESVFALAHPGTPQNTVATLYPDPVPAFSVLSAFEAHVTDVYENPVANVPLHYQWITGAPGTNVLRGFISPDFLIPYLQIHSWPTTNEVAGSVSPEINMFSDTYGDAAVYPALGDAVTPGVTSVSTFQYDAGGAVLHTTAVSIFGIPQFTFQVEPRASYFGSTVEAYSPGEHVHGNADIVIKQIDIGAVSDVAQLVYVNNATVTFNFPGSLPVTVDGADQGSYQAEYPPMPAEPQAYRYTAHVHLPGIDFNTTGLPIWVVRPTVLPNEDNRSFLVPQGGANCGLEPVKFTLEPSEYLDRGNALMVESLLTNFSMVVPDPNDVLLTHSAPVGVQSLGSGTLTSSIDSGLLTSENASVMVAFSMNRSWAASALRSTGRFDVSAVSTRIEPQLTNACMLTGDPTPFDVIMRPVSNGVVHLVDWNATISARDASDPNSQIFRPTLSDVGDVRKTTIDNDLLQSISSMDEPLFEGTSSLGHSACPMPVQSAFLQNSTQPFLHVRIHNVFMRNIHRSCHGRNDIPNITLLPLPEGSSWTVNLNGTAVPDPDGNANWQPGTYETPYPTNQPEGNFTVDAVTACPNGQATLHWNGDIKVDTLPEGGLPIGHPIVKGVDLATGAYHLTREDLIRPGLAGGLSLVRSFSNTGNFAEQALGKGWSFNFEVTLTNLVTCQVIMASDINGTPYEFDGSTNPPSAFAGYHGTLETVTDGYVLTTKDGTKYSFELAALQLGDDLKYLLRSIKDPFGNTTQIDWQVLPGNSDAAIYRVETVTDPSGRTLSIAYASSNTVVTGPDGERFVYEKDENGFLKSVKRYQGESPLWDESYSYVGVEEASYGNLQTFTDRDHRQTRITYFSADPDPDYQSAPAGVDDLVITNSPQYNHVKELLEGQVLQTRFAYDLRSVQQTPGFMSAKVTNGKNETSTYTIGQEGESLSITIDALGQTTSTQWDLTQFVKTKEIDALGRQTTYLYNSAGDQTDVTTSNTSPYPLTDGNGNTVDSITIHRDYDPIFHRVNLESMPDGVTTTYTIDPINGSVAAKHEQGPSSSREEMFAYSSQGNILSDTNFENETTSFSNYDALGNARRIDYPLNHFIQRTFDARGRRTSETSSEGRSESWEYNDLDQLIKHAVTDTRGGTDLFVEQWSYSAEGLLAEHSDSTGLVESPEYDSLGRKTHQTIATGTILPDGSSEIYSTSWTYDAAGRIETRTDPDAVHSFIYDAAGRVLNESIEDKLLYSQQFDAAGNVRFKTDHRGATTEYQYDALYRKIKEIAPEVECVNPDGSKVACSPDKNWRYDRTGKITLETDANGNQHSYIYDDFKRLAEEHLPLGHQMIRTYDKVDRLKTEEQQPQALLISKNYDDLGRVILETRTLEAQGVNDSTTFEFDDTNQTVLVTNAAGEKQKVAYDSLGHVKSLILDPDGLNLQQLYLYDGHGKQRRETDPNGNTTLWVNDALGRRIQGTSPLLTIEDAQGQSNHQRATTSRQFDFTGRVLVETDPRGAKIVHSYDPLGRELTRDFAFQGNSESLAAWQYHDNASLNPPDRDNPVDPSVTETDGRGNIIQHWFDGMGREAMTMDQENHASQMLYDRNSNLASKIDRRGFEQRVSYDALNRKTENRWVGGATGSGGDLVETVSYDDPARTVTTVDRMGFYHVQIQDEAGRKLEERVEERLSGGNVNSIINGRWNYDGVDRIADQLTGTGTNAQLVRCGGAKRRQNRRGKYSRRIRDHIHFRQHGSCEDNQRLRRPYDDKGIRQRLSAAFRNRQTRKQNTVWMGCGQPSCHHDRWRKQQNLLHQ